MFREEADEATVEKGAALLNGRLRGENARYLSSWEYLRMHISHANNLTIQSERLASSFRRHVLSFGSKFKVEPKIRKTKKKKSRITAKKGKNLYYILGKIWKTKYRQAQIPVAQQKARNIRSEVCLPMVSPKSNAPAPRASPHSFRAAFNLF